MAKKAAEVDDSWNRFPETRFRMREDGLKTILEGLSEDGFCSGSVPRFDLMDDGVYVEIMLNVGKHGSVIALPFEIFIPAKIPASKKREKKINAPSTVESDSNSPTVELHDEQASTAEPVAPSDVGV